MARTTTSAAAARARAAAIVRRRGEAGHDDRVGPRPAPARWRHASVGATSRRRVGRRQVGRLRLDDARARSLGRSRSGNRPASSRTSVSERCCELGGQRRCWKRSATTSSPGWRKPAQPRPQLAQAAPGRCPDRRAQSPRRSAWLRPSSRRASWAAIGRCQQQVLAGAHGGDRVDYLRRALGERVHVERIGDRQAAEAELLAQHPADDRAATGSPAARAHPTGPAPPRGRSSSAARRRRSPPERAPAHAVRTGRGRAGSTARP